jgi:hypothetical protein
MRYIYTDAQIDRPFWVDTAAEVAVLTGGGVKRGTKGAALHSSR